MYESIKYSQNFFFQLCIQGNCINYIAMQLEQDKCLRFEKWFCHIVKNLSCNFTLEVNFWGVDYVTFLTSHFTFFIFQLFLPQVIKVQTSLMTFSNFSYRENSESVKKMIETCEKNR